jgi:hypothetical protein
LVKHLHLTLGREILVETLDVYTIAAY